MYYFAFGSNMLYGRLEERIGMAVDIGKCLLLGYELKFNKKSKDDSGKANIVEKEEGKVFGVLYEVNKSQIEKLDSYEKGYSQCGIKVQLLGGQPLQAITYCAKENAEGLFPTSDYLDLILCGAKEHFFDPEYLDFLRKFRKT